MGGSAGAGGSGAQVGTGGTPAKGSLAWPAEKPSFVLSTTDQEPSYTGPAFGQVRLDLRQEAGGFSAAIGAQVACSVAVDSSAVTLSACGQQGNTTIEKVVLPRALDGALTGTFQAVSRYDGLYQGDMLVHETTEFSGTLAVDATAPGFELQQWGTLPWYGLQLDLDEGVDEQQLLAAVSVAAASGPAPAVTWKAVPGTPAWSGARRLSGALTDFIALAGGTTLEVGLGAVSDLNGNVSLPAKDTLSLAPLGTPLGIHDFEAGQTLAFYGKVVLETGASAGVCESGACLTLGPGDSCAGGGAHLRGLLLVSGKSQLRLRSRIVADGPTAVPAFALRLFAPSGEKSTTKVGHFDGAKTTPVLGLGHGASFGDDVVPLPATGSVVGFELAMELDSDSNFCSPGATAALVLERVAAE